MSLGQQSLIKAFQYYASTRPKEKILLVPNGEEYEEINFQNFDFIINKYANYWKKQLKNENLKKNSVIGYLSQSGPEYLYNIMALWKLGFVILLLSPRNSEADLVHLLQEAKSHILIHNLQLSKISKNVQNKMNSQYSQKLKIFQLSKNLKNEKIDHSEPFWFNFISQINKPDDIILSTAPLFHMYGFIRVLTFILNPGSVYVFPIVAGSVPLINEILHSLKQSNASVFYTLPAILEQIHKNHSDEIKILTKLRSVYYAGAALLPHVGEQLIKSGVKIISNYGTTEVGVIMSSLKDSSSPEFSKIPWNAMKFLIPKNYYKLIERNDIIDGAKEL
ncbi:992_t:CDS:2, partial [Scutellospora calospora]